MILIGGVCGREQDTKVTPLMLATDNHFAACVTILLKRGADKTALTIKDSQNRTAVDLIQSPWVRDAYKTCGVAVPEEINKRCGATPTDGRAPMCKTTEKPA